MPTQTPRHFGTSTTLLVSESPHHEAARRGTILFYHGLRGFKEVNLREMEQIATRGFLVVGVDQWGHGERETEESRSFLNGEHPEFPSRFLTAVRRGAAEVPTLLDELESAGLVHEGRIGIGGISMGGYLTYAAVLLEPRLKVAVSIVGSPRWRFDAAESPMAHIEAFDNVALLSLNASLDAAVPAADAREFHRLLADKYSSNPKHDHHEYPHSEHMMREEDWNDCMRRTVEWYDKWM